MSAFFLKILNMSISASWIVLAVLVIRLIFKKAPKWINTVLWGIVGLRLIMPFSLESVFSLIPSVETISKTSDSPRPYFESGVTIVDNQVNDYLKGHYFEGITRPEGYFADITVVFAAVWLAGMALLLIYTLISYLRLRNKIGTAVLLEDNIYQSERVISPFVLGIIKPKIYLPFNINDQDKEHVIAHEKAHISRKDHLWKPIGFLILILHWFNPLMWHGYILLCRDIELACDEKVIKESDTKQKADYSQALLNCSVNRHTVSACPIAFGETDVKRRVKSVLSYKKPALFVIISAAAASVLLAVCFLTNPMTTLGDELSGFIDMRIAEHNFSETNTNDNFITTNYKVLNVKNSFNKTTVYMWALYREYSYDNGQIKLESGAYIPTVITAKRTGKHGHYQLIEYWEPRDGSYYANDIREKFPWYLRSKALDSQRYINELISSSESAANEYFSHTYNIDGLNNDGMYEATEAGEIEEKYDSGEYVIFKDYYKIADDNWFCNGYTYKYRLEISGRMSGAAGETTYIVLSNTKDITFEQAWKASGLSSNNKDYFGPEQAVIVGNRIFS